jgi:hypothetical protein
MVSKRWRRYVTLVHLSNHGLSKPCQQLVEDLHPVLYGYYSTMITVISSDTVTPQTISSSKIHDDILLAHLVYKSIVKMAVWLWNRIDKMPKQEVERNQAWVSGSHLRKIWH